MTDGKKLDERILNLKKDEVIKTLAIVLIPGALPLWLGYKIYEGIKDRHKGKSGTD